MSRWSALLTLALLGCAPDNGTAVLLTIDGTMLDAAERAAIVELDFDVEGVESYQKSLSLGRSFSPSGHERILYQSKASGGHLELAIVARDSQGVELAAGSIGADLRDGKTVSATLSLGVESGDGGEDAGVGDGGGLVITPMTVSVPVTRAQLFSANQPVTWSVMEGAAGGDIDAAGKYWAPVTPGTYHVVATSIGSSGLSATATVTATPLSLKLLAGGIGGPGNLDGVGEAARFSNPTGVCGSYVADTGNHAIRRIDSFNNNRVSTVAGNGSPGDADGIGAAAQLSSPGGIDCDSSAVYIADSGNGKIKKLLISTGAVSTLVSGLSNPSDVLLDLARNQLVVSDQMRGIIYSVSLPSPTPVPLAGNGQMSSQDSPIGLSASFNLPTRLALTPASQLLVVDGGGLRNVDLTPGNNAAVTTVNGMFLASIGGVSSEYLSAFTALYTINPRDMAADLFVLALGALSFPGWVDGDSSTAAFLRVNYIDRTSTLLTDGNVVRKLTGSGSSLAVQTLAGANVQGSLADGTGVAASFNLVTGMTVDDSGNAWVADNNRIRKVDLTSGAVTTLTLIPSPTPTPSPGPPSFYEGMAYYQGQLYLPNANRNTLDRLDVSTGILTHVAGEAGVSGSSDGVGTAAHFNFPGYVVSDGHGVIYLSDVQNNMIRSYDVGTGMVSTVAGNPTAGSTDAVGTLASFSRPDGLALDGNGGLYVADRGNLVIRKIDLATFAVSRFAGAYGQSGTTDGTLDQARFESPWALACDGHSLFVTNLNPTTPPAEPAVRQIDLASGMVAHFVGAPSLQGIATGPLPASLSNESADAPLAIAVTPAGDLLITDFSAFLIVQSP